MTTARLADAHQLPLAPDAGVGMSGLDLHRDDGFVFKAKQALATNGGGWL